MPIGGDEPFPSADRDGSWPAEHPHLDPERSGAHPMEGETGGVRPTPSDRVTRVCGAEEDLGVDEMRRRATRRGGHVGGDVGSTGGIEGRRKRLSEDHETDEVFGSARVDDVREAVAAHDAGLLMIVVESADGSASPILDLSEKVGPIHRGSGAVAMQSTPGGFSDLVGLSEEMVGVLVVDDAQWVDPSSIGRIQRVIRHGRGPLVVVLAHRVETELDGWGIAQTVAAARERGIPVMHTSIPADADARASLDLSPAERDLLGAASLVFTPIPVPVVASLLGMDEERALITAEGLVERGLLEETRRGFARPPGSVPVDLGEARLGRVATRLADSFETEGGAGGVVAKLRLMADDADRAFPALAAAAVAARDHGALGEAFRLAGEAIGVSGRAAGADRSTIGALHLICGQYLRATGRSDDAADHLAWATGLLEGDSRTDALGFAAAVADDRQRPQEAERILAMAEWEALAGGAFDKHLSLVSFRSKMLSRIGFAQEADDMHVRALALAESHGTDHQRRYVTLNRAWVHLDRGEALAAEESFARLGRRQGGGDPATAEAEACRARALFACGRPREALEAIETARGLAVAGDVDAPFFLAELALLEGNLLYGRSGAALESAERVVDLVESQFRAWANVARLGRAQALVGLGRLDEARTEVGAALEATPGGADGWRLRARGLAVGLAIDAVDGTWERGIARDLADALLQSRYYGWAIELMCVIAEHSRADASLADDATALALRVGNPMLAARANAARAHQRDSLSTQVVNRVHRLRAEVPGDWESDWERAPGVGTALAVQMSDEGDAVDVGDRFEGVLRQAGLSGDVVLSPAQRRSAGLVARPGRRRLLPSLAAALGVAAVAAATAFGVSALTGDEPPATVIREVVQVDSTVPTEVTLALEDTEIGVPDEVDFLSGRADHRGGNERAGLVDANGPTEVDGYYWRYHTAGPILATPVAHGKNLLVGSADGTMYALNLTNGSVLWTLETEGSIAAPSALGSVSVGEGRQPTMVVVVGDDGIVRAREADIEIAAERWSTPVGTRVRSSPVVLESEGRVVVASTDGRVTALSLLDGSEIWSYPGPEEDLGAISADLAAAEGLIYVGTEAGELHVVEASTGEMQCQVDLSTQIVASPIVADGVVYVPTRGNTIFVFPVGTCSGTAPDRLPLYVTETPVETPPAVVGDTMYLPSGRFLYAIDLTDNSHRWPADTVAADTEITAAPVVDSNTVYFGTEDGLAVAVDAASGEHRFSWQTSNIMRASPVVIDGGVYVAAGDGSVTALGPGRPEREASSD